MENITVQDLKNKINNKETFYLDIKGSWCGPCKVLLNILGQVDTTLKSMGNMKPIFIADVDEDREYFMNVLNVRSVPTTKIFKEGVENYSKIGVLKKEEISTLLNEI